MEEGTYKSVFEIAHEHLPEDLSETPELAYISGFSDGYKFREESTGINEEDAEKNKYIGLGRKAQFIKEFKALLARFEIDQNTNRTLNGEYFVSSLCMDSRGDHIEIDFKELFKACGWTIR